MTMIVPLLGQVAASRPVEFIPIKSWREIRPVRGAHWRKRYAGLTVIGDSMIEENICDGDIVIFEMTHEAREGDLVVALTLRKKALAIAHEYQPTTRSRSVCNCV